ncbi:MAG: hypothetical protein H2043_18300 [Rhizobiales bacterium]|nr:hypothetical protein [Hyphomicrobiales bacterium]
MDMTPNLNLPIPNADAVPATKISEEFPRLADALIMLDAIIFALQGVVAGKAAADHTQAISTITGLTEALAAKMPANTTFSLDSLTDVQGATDALVNYVLVKKASGQWEPSTALAALGIHNHSISEVVGLTEQLVDILEAIDLLASGKADKTTSIGVAGLATGGGNLSANRTITVPKSDATDAVAGSRDDVAMTPKTTRDAMKLRNGGTVTLSGTSVEITSIPADVQRVTLDVDALFSSGTNPRLELGDATSFPASGYEGGNSRVSGSGSSAAATNSAYLDGGASFTRIEGRFELTRQSGNIWRITFIYAYTSGGHLYGSVKMTSLSSALSRLRLSTGSAATMSGTAKVWWEF